MGTISEAIVTFIKSYQTVEIDTGHIQDGSDTYGLFKSPNRDVKLFNDYSQEITEYYQFMAKQSSISNNDRKTADEWLEDLTYWVDDYGLNYAYPTLTGNRKITNIELTGCPYPMESTEDETLYQMSLKITYTREREEL
jgi:hypothetical protein